ncbi:MAG: 23S rRNA (adenine(2503)-C(2))-methyltransferase RlmN [Clostridiaceae bacterium]|nr:23S rRNA (adenine(2503)-C(2))-methyltransferase RlmN [Clostridiaceae bacterium]
MTDTINVLDLNIDQLKRVINDLGEPDYRAKQVWEWVYNGAGCFDDMTNLPKSFRSLLKSRLYIGDVSIVKKLVSDRNGTVKYLFALPDGKVIESVLMKYRYGNSACLSTQIGCRMGCRFCASARLGIDRNLTAGEMMAQFIAMQKDCGERISRVVLMGIGEPFDNYDEVVRFMRRLNQKDTFGISYRRMTVSTCGLVPEINRFSCENIPVNLSISLHAPNDEIRRRIMPVAARYSIDKILSACNIYIRKTGRRVTFEYILIDGVNDRDEHAVELSERISGLLCHVNLIPLNAVEGIEYRRSGRERTEAFKKILERYGIPVTVRRELGDDISASCGQLRKKSIESDGMVD